MAGQQIGFWEDDEYRAFEEKFKPKKTTDVCYTPPEIFDCIAEWACEKYGFAKNAIVRPFYPGGDFINFDYSPGCVVLDNPPFSLLSVIVDFYLQQKIKFFLFAPTLTAFSGRKSNLKCTHVICAAQIVYANGAKVPTSFVTNLGGDIVAQSEPELTARINAVILALRREKAHEMPKYTYPEHVLTAAMLQYLAAHGVAYSVRRADLAFIPRLDAQRSAGKSIFGGGFLLSRRAAAEKAAAEEAAAEKIATGGASIEWRLSEREREIINGLGADE